MRRVRRSKGAVAAGWTPPDILGCVLWLDANKITGLADGAEVLTWIDASGTGNDATGNSGQVPVYKTNIQNGLPVVRYDGAGDILTITGLGTGSFSGISKGTAFVVFSPTSDAEYAVLYFAGVNTGFWRWGEDGNGYMALFRSARLVGAPTAQPTTGWHLHTIRSGPTNGYDIRRNGSLDVDVAASWGVSTDATLGLEYAGTDLAGDIGEVILYNDELSDADVATVEAYLSDKWGIALA